jgi:hypothetical protein
MKRTLLLNLLLLVSTGLFAQVGIGTTTPKAALEVVSANSGMLIPRYATLAAANTNSLPTLNASDHTGLMIYVAEEANRGFWFYDGSAFVKVGTPTKKPASRTRSVLLSAGDFDILPGSTPAAPTKELLHAIPVLSYAPKSISMSQVLVPIPADWNGTSPFTLTGFYTSLANPGNFTLWIGQTFLSLNMTIGTTNTCELVIPAASGSYALMEFTTAFCASPTTSSKVMSLAIYRIGDEEYGDTAATNFSLLGLRIDYQD